MEGHGFSRAMLDVKGLILYVAARARYPMSLQTIYELCYQDDCLSYFDLSVAVPQMVESGHLEEPEKDRFVITEKGRETEEVTEDAIAYPVKQRAAAAVERFNEQTRREDFLRTEIRTEKSGEYTVVLALNDGAGELMSLELPAPTQQQARALVKSFRERADRVYQAVMDTLLKKEKVLTEDHADL